MGACATGMHRNGVYLDVGYLRAEISRPPRELDHRKLAFVNRLQQRRRRPPARSMQARDERYGRDN